jgi:hypothetical protein
VCPSEGASGILAGAFLVRRVAVVGGASWADWSVWTPRFVVSQLVVGGILEWRRFWQGRSNDFLLGWARF